MKTGHKPKNNATEKGPILLNPLLFSPSLFSVMPIQ
jgi:hypothetical protein